VGRDRHARAGTPREEELPRESILRPSRARVLQRCTREDPARTHSNLILLDGREPCISLPACLPEDAPQSPASDFVTVLAICDGYAAALQRVAKHVVRTMLSVQVPSVSPEPAQNLSRFHKHCPHPSRERAESARPEAAYRGGSRNGPIEQEFDCGRGKDEASELAS